MAIMSATTIATTTTKGHPTLTKSILKKTEANNNTSHASLQGSRQTLIWKKVCFDDVHIREFGFVLGDNPAVSKGAPLTITWDHHNEDVVDVDIFEHCRGPVRRHRKKIVLSARKRAKILLSAGHTVEEIADVTLACQMAKKQRVESLKAAGNWDLTLLGSNINLADFMSGTAEVTGRTLLMMPETMGNAGKHLVQGTGKLVLGTGKVASDVVVGTGRLGYDVVVGTGKVATDVVVGTGRMATDVVVGTGKVGLDVVKGTGTLTRDVVVGTGTLTRDVVMSTGNVVLGGVKGAGRAARRLTSIFSPADLIKQDDLKATKAHLNHVEPPLARSSTADAVVVSPRRSPNHSHAREPQRRSRRPNTGERNSPKRDQSPRRAKSGPMPRVVSPLKKAKDEDEMLDELTEMETFMLHLQGMDPEQIREVLSSQ